MVIHSQVDWRSPHESLSWDLALVRSVFWRIHKRYDEEQRTRLSRPKRGDNQRENASNKAEQLETPMVMDDDRLVAKADVLRGLATTELYLDKRPFLRSLHTALACCSAEKEMESVNSYVKTRVRDRTTSYTMVAAMLRDIYTKHIDLLAFEAKIQEFKTAARAKSTWCVRDYKSICTRPSHFYGVHNIPPKPKTARQIEMEQQMIHSHALAVANNAISVVVTKLVEAARPPSRAKSSYRGSARRGGVEQAALTPAQIAAVKARQKRGKQDAEDKRKQLRLEIMVPGVVTTRQSSAFGMLSAPDNSKPTVKTIALKQRELLALAEANGAVGIAQQLLQQTIPSAGFSRVAEHLANLHGPCSDERSESMPSDWEVLKLWKTVYRNRTVQAVQRLEH